MSDASGEDLVALAQRGVKRAQALGAVEAEVYAVRQSSVRVEFRGRLGDVHESSEGGVCVRVALGKRTGSAGQPGLGEESLQRAIERAVENARAAPEDPRFRHHPDAQPVTAPPTRVDARVAMPESDRILQDAKDAAASLARQKDVTYVAFQLSASAVTFGVANARGVAAWDQDARESLQSELRVSDGALHKTANEFAVAREPVSARHDVARLMEDAAARARAALRAKPLPGVVDKVVFDPATSAQVLGALVDHLALASAKKDGYSQRVGQRVASPAVTLRDLPRAGTGNRAQRVDDEGVPTRDATILDAGVLRALPSNSYIAHQKGEPSTGNGYRPFESRWNATPKSRFGSLDFAAGPGSVEDLLAGVDRAVYVRDLLLGYFTSNQVTGDFSAVAPLAFLVEKGEIVQALPPTTVAGNAFRMLEDVEAVSRERRTLLRGTFPSMRVRGVTCAT